MNYLCIGGQWFVFRRRVGNVQIRDICKYKLINDDTVAACGFLRLPALSGAQMLK
uniref:hypothetical protein n=1 Tax=Shigella flexneri TaxID=623 RepID=UPI0002DB52B2